MTQTAYLNSGGDVRALSSQVRTLVEAQAVDATITEVIAGAPDELISVDHTRIRGKPPYYHRKVSGDGTAIGHYSQIGKLKAYKRQRFDEIDDRTDELIAEGFTYNTKVFSWSVKAQSKLAGLHQVRNDGALVYPYKWNTIDDIGMISIANAVDLHTFYMTGLATYWAHVDSGTALKIQIRSATTKAEVDAVVDTR